METKQVTMTSDELVQYEAFKEKRAKELAQKQKEDDRNTYKTLVDETIVMCMPDLVGLSQTLRDMKKNTFDSFKNVLELKEQVYGIKPDQRSNAFTHSDGKSRIMLGEYETDDWDDTVNEGVAMVKKFISSLAKDNDSQMLVDAIMKLLSKDKAGNLKATRVMQLRKMAEQSSNEEFIEGVKIIEDAHRPTVSRQYIRAERKDEQGRWIRIPLGITEA